MDAGAITNAVYHDTTGQWISDAEVAATVHTAFEPSRHKVTARLIERRVRTQLGTTRTARTVRTWPRHALLTDNDEPTVDADLTHRGHAIVEQVFADLIDGLLATPAIGPVRRQRRPG